MKRSQIRAIEEAMAYPNGFGYVLDFSDRTISEFFEDEFGIDLEDPLFSANGSSKRNRLTTLIATEDAYTVAKVLRALWDRREGLMRRSGGKKDEDAEKETTRVFLEIVAGVEGSSNIPRTDALDRYARDRTLDELILDIERDLQANKPEAAMATFTLIVWESFHICCEHGESNVVTKSHFTPGSASIARNY